MADAHISPADLECAASWIDNHLGLMQWIELARTLLDAIQGLAHCDKELAEKLREYSVPYNLFWDERASAGLFQLTEDVAQGAHRAIAAAKEIALKNGPNS